MKNQTINAVTVGSFDYRIHAGHIDFLQRATTLCDRLFVCVVPDWVIIRNKNRRPYFSAVKRARNVLATNLVDGVFIADNIQGFRFDLMLIGTDQNLNPWTCTMIEKIPSASILQLRITSTTEELQKRGLLEPLVN